MSSLKEGKSEWAHNNSQMIRICAAYLNYRDSNSARLFFSDILIRFGGFVNTLSFSSSLHLCLCQTSLFSIPFPYPSLSLSQHPFKILPLLFLCLFPLLCALSSPSYPPPLSLSAEAKPHPSVKRAKCWRHTKTTYPAAVKKLFQFKYT